MSGTDHLFVSEIFGPTLQGEGPSAGTPAAFVRLAGCNLDCTWCDTRYSWDWERHPIPDSPYGRMTQEQVYRELQGHLAQLERVELVVISGGEPLLQREPLQVLADRLLADGHRLEIETNGTMPPLRYQRPDVRYIISPKLQHAQVSSSALPDPAWRRRTDTYLKFVVQDFGCVDEMDSLIRALAVPAERVIVMPEGAHPDRLDETAEVAADKAIACGWRYTDRLHIRLWNGERAR